MLTFPNAKINLGLDIVSKRPDGYHNISSCFIPVNWKDALEIVPSDEFKFSSSGLEIPGKTESNLCVKAYELLKTDYDIGSVHIHLHKVIPMGGGLGGGSADGAFALKMLDKEFGLNLTIEQLQSYAKKLGADCPFFIENKPVLVSGIGEIFDDIDLDLSRYKVVIVNPMIHVPTKIAFSQVMPQKPNVEIKDILNSPVTNWKSQLKNDFEPSVFDAYPEILSLKDKLYTLGADYVSMTGSGASVYGLFPSEADELDLKLHFGDMPTFISQLSI
ncbi:4-(cytidine 5'-diphospho)-2-C-methyl-D-erythritol kinase [Reichenbachiella versicolor]|uniref:4-(cytidine 5'-diphospho)-2-C-methyl-D-erythritol kinase n=1 Tax=Reichenbachiella versicolor TaxID=1821036 RepID=UPI000D6E8810|nr:4-(cytidine 5'-diphospho)-2-C-methyl-D-erythritol kinase [Reichenbachiella versicolor]